MRLDSHQLWHLPVVVVLSVSFAGCGAPPPLRTNATYPQHENVAPFIDIWSHKTLTAENFEGLKRLVPIGVARSKFQDVLSLAEVAGRSQGKTFYSFDKDSGNRKEGSCSLGVAVDEKTDPIIDATVIVVHK